MNTNAKIIVSIMLVGVLVDAKLANAQAIIAGDKFFCITNAISVNGGPPIKTSNAQAITHEYKHPFLFSKYLNSPQTKVVFDRVLFHSNDVEIDEGNKIKVTRFLSQSNGVANGVSVFLDNKMKLSMMVKSSESKGVVTYYSGCELVKGETKAAPADTMKHGVIVGKGRAYFHNKDNNIFKRIDNLFLIPGDQFFAGEMSEDGKMIFVEYNPKGGYIVEGWMSADRIRLK
jgi:hypothetical protein